MALEHKNAAGIFADRQHTESALDQLKAADFPMNKVSVVGEHVKSEDVTLKATEATVQSEAQFVRDRTIERIEHGALDAGSWGSIIGFLGGGLVTLAIPGISSIVLAGARAASVGLATGAFYGAVAGGLLGAAMIGTNIPDEQVKLYNQRLAQGQYLIVLEGTNDELQQAETVLKTQGIQDWIIFDSL
ncbi:DUF1269 domain-containing protein [Nostoc sp.]|uniref:DUF1269 domain-containing protein n=1 Tax=Nostoc sp. TaxID=1180 RepID=UPI002FF5CC4E